MTHEEKHTLLVDICARLPYKLYATVRDLDNKECEPFEILGIKGEQVWVYNQMLCVNNYDTIEVIRPFLRPMSSMTDEERGHLQSLHNIISDENYGDGFSPAAWEAILDFNNYCREHHLDNGGLITLGLALEAPEGIYDIKTE